MGALNSTLTPETVIGGGAVAATIAVSALMYANKPGDQADGSKDVNSDGGAADKINSGEKKQGKNANRKRKGKGASGEKDDGTPAALAAPAELFESKVAAVASAVAPKDLTSSITSTKSKTRKRARKAKTPNASTPALNVDATPNDDSEDEDNATPEPQPLASSSTSAKGRNFNKFTSLTESQVSTSPAMEASWTHVGKRVGKKNAVDASFDASSDAGMATSSVTGDDASSAAGETGRMTLAEQFQAMKPKTAVDDMLPPEEIARVMRVTSLQEDDMLHSTDADAEEEGWGIVRRKRQNPNPTSGFTPISQPPPELSKDQRRREARKEAQKQAKAEAEADRLKRLASHKKEQEKARMDEIDRLAKLTGKSGKVSGGMTAVVQKDGRLVWE